VHGKTHHVPVLPSSKYLTHEELDKIHSMVVVWVEGAIPVEVWLWHASSSFAVEVRSWVEGNVRTHDVDSG
jgi:hypothetical protein